MRYSDEEQAFLRKVKKKRVHKLPEGDFSLCPSEAEVDGFIDVSLDTLFSGEGDE